MRSAPASFKTGSRVRRLLILLVGLSLLTACSDSATSTTTATTTTLAATTTETPTTTTTPPTTTTEAPTTTTTMLPGIVATTGTSDCRITSRDFQDEEGRQIVFEHFSCTQSVSDPRVSGQFEADIITTLEPPDASVAAWTATYSLANEGGTWQGTGRGALVFWPEGGGPYNYGEGTYTGEGGYAGLTYHELVAGTNGTLMLSGWIEAQP